MYAKLLSEKLRRHHAHVWLVNTGWAGGSYGTGARISLKYTRAIIQSIYSGELADAPVVRDPIFGLDVVTACPGVPAEILVPRQSWSDAASYEATAQARRPVPKELHPVCRWRACRSPRRRAGRQRVGSVRSLDAE
ncbi:MAG: phosphoenolpyruvate carboxykinase (ATP) [Planctomycetaceae bacterium]